MIVQEFITGFAFVYALEHVRYVTPMFCSILFFKFAEFLYFTYFIIFTKFLPQFPPLLSQFASMLGDNSQIEGRSAIEGAVGKGIMSKGSTTRGKTILSKGRPKGINAIASKIPKKKM